MGDNQYKKRHREQGLCTDCSNPVMPGCIRCVECLCGNAKAKKIETIENREKLNYRVAKRRAMFRKSGRCTKCGAVLDPDIDEGFITCQNCREGIFYEV